MQPNEYLQIYRDASILWIALPHGHPEVSKATYGELGGAFVA